MIVIDNEIYIERANNYVKCDLMVNSNGAYYLRETEHTIRRFPNNFESLTWKELLARYGNLAVHDRNPSPGSEVANAAKTTGATSSAARRTRKEE